MYLYGCHSDADLYKILNSWVLESQVLWLSWIVGRYYNDTSLPPVACSESESDSYLRRTTFAVSTVLCACTVPHCTVLYGCVCVNTLSHDETGFSSHYRYSTVISATVLLYCVLLLGASDCGLDILGTTDDTIVNVKPVVDFHHVMVLYGTVWVQ